MIIDSSAVVAIIEGEPDRDRCIDRLLEARSRRMSAANLLETYIRIDRSGATDAGTLVDEFVSRFVVRIDPVTYVQARIARDAFERYGRGSGHPARLNHGDCFAYALARLTAEPILFVGNDFNQTDLDLA